MHGKKSARSRIEPRGTPPALTSYSCKHCPSRTTQSYLILTKDENKAKYPT